MGIFHSMLRPAELSAFEIFGFPLPHFPEKYKIIAHLVKKIIKFLNRWSRFILHEFR